MEKRTLLAIVLSSLVLLIHQAFFVPKPTTEQTNQQTQNVIEETKPSSSLSSIEKELNAVEIHQEETPNLPEQIYTIENDKILLKISSKGAVIQDVFFKEYDHDFQIGHLMGSDFFDTRDFEFQKFSSNHVVLSHKSDGIVLSKVIELDNDYMISVKHQIFNESENTINVKDKIYPIFLDFNDLESNNENVRQLAHYEYAVSEDGDIKRKNNAHKFSTKREGGFLGFFKPEYRISDEEVDWVGFRDTYFATIIRPDFDLKGYKVEPITEKELRIQLNIPETVLRSDEDVTYRFDVFVGPQATKVLEKYSDYNFDDFLSYSSFGIIDFFAKTTHAFLRVIHRVIPNWGLCIIILALTIYGITYPLNINAMKSMKKMQLVQPKMAALKEKYEKDPQRLNQEMMKLYQSEGVNPLGGCLPMILQMPIFFSLYPVLERSFYFRGADFLWISDLSKPDHLFKFPFKIPVLGEYFNLLPILMIGIMFIQQKMNANKGMAMTPEQQTQQKLMQTIFPIFFGIIFYNFASGLSLYFTIFYILSTFTHWRVSNMKAS